MNTSSLLHQSSRSLTRVSSPSLLCELVVAQVSRLWKCCLGRSGTHLLESCGHGCVSRGEWGKFSVCCYQWSSALISGRVRRMVREVFGNTSGSALVECHEYFWSANSLNSWSATTSTSVSPSTAQCSPVMHSHGSSHILLRFISSACDPCPLHAYATPDWYGPRTRWTW